MKNFATFCVFFLRKIVIPYPLLAQENEQLGSLCGNTIIQI